MQVCVTCRADIDGVTTTPVVVISFYAAPLWLCGAAGRAAEHSSGASQQ